MKTKYMKTESETKAILNLEPGESCRHVNSLLNPGTKSGHMEKILLQSFKFSAFCGSSYYHSGYTAGQIGQRGMAG
jgi:hypothetical protein